MYGIKKEILEKMAEERFYGDMLSRIKTNINNTKELVNILREVYSAGYSEAYDKYWYDSS